MEVVLINLGKLQIYIFDTIKQLKLFNNKITLILDDNLVDNFDKVENISICKTSQIDIGDFDNSNKLCKEYRDGFWALCSKRLFYLYHYMKKYQKINCFHIENDNMVYDNLENIYNKLPDKNKIWITMDSPSRCIPGIMFVNNHTYLEPLITNYIHDKNDMDNMALFYINNKELCEPLPIIVKNSFYENNDIYNRHQDIKLIFDGAAIGQYLGGVDPRNIPGDTVGFINETCVVKYNDYKFIWKLESNLFVPYILIGDTYYKIINLHIHSKNLSIFSSLNPVENINISKQYSYIISGEQIQTLADVYLGDDYDFNFNPNIDKSKCIHINNISNGWNNPELIFCYSHRINDIDVSVIQNKCVFIFGNSDENLTFDKCKKYLENNLVQHIFCQNIDFSHPKASPLPIGIANSQWPHGNILLLKNIMSLNLIKDNLIFCSFNPHTNITTRNNVLNTLQNKGISNKLYGNQEDYLRELSKSNYCICPEGNGIDTHRFWECLYLKTVPIVKSCILYQTLASINVPCVLINSWDDLNIEKLPDYTSFKFGNNIWLEYLVYNIYKFISE